MKLGSISITLFRVLMEASVISFEIERSSLGDFRDQRHRIQLNGDILLFERFLERPRFARNSHTTGERWDALDWS